MLDNLSTETRNEKTLNLDTMSIREFCEIMNEEDQKVPLAIKECLGQIEETIKVVSNSLKNNGRLIYIGAGTSGRIGLLDAVECVPTFGVSKETVVGLIAGGEMAFVKAVEGAEDDEELGINDVKAINLNKKDVLIGIAASGRTPYVISALKYANSIGVMTVGISCNKNSPVGNNAKIAIEVEVGAEVLTGSTRLKSGTCQKLIVNMISTGSMVHSGKVYKNLMVDVQMTNEKLYERGRRIVMEATGVDYETANKVLENANNKPKTAIVMILKDCTCEIAEKALVKANGFVRMAIQQ